MLSPHSHQTFCLLNGIASAFPLGDFCCNHPLNPAVSYSIWFCHYILIHFAIDPLVRAKSCASEKRQLWDGESSKRRTERERDCDNIPHAQTYSFLSHWVRHPFTIQLNSKLNPAIKSTAFRLRYSRKAPSALILRVCHGLIQTEDAIYRASFIQSGKRE